MSASELLAGLIQASPFYLLVAFVARALAHARARGAAGPDRPARARGRRRGRRHRGRPAAAGHRLRGAPVGPHAAAHADRRPGRLPDRDRPDRPAAAADPRQARHAAAALARPPARGRPALDRRLLRLAPARRSTRRRCTATSSTRPSTRRCSPPAWALWIGLLGPLPKPAWFGAAAGLAYVLVVRFAGTIIANVFLWSSSPFYPDYVELARAARHRRGGGPEPGGRDLDGRGLDRDDLRARLAVRALDGAGRGGRGARRARPQPRDRARSRAGAAGGRRRRGRAAARPPGLRGRRGPGRRGRR